MPIQFKDADAAKADFVQAEANLIATRDIAEGLKSQFFASSTTYNRLIARAAAGDTVSDAEWNESEAEITRLRRLAERFKAILTVQTEILKTVIHAALPFALAEDTAAMSMDEIAAVFEYLRSNKRRELA